VRSSPARSLGAALVVTALAVVLMYLAATWGIAAFNQARSPSDAGVGALPIAVDNPPASVGTTDQYGPLGAVSLVFAGTDVEHGLLGDVEQPWLAVAARTGDYRAVVAPDLPSAQAGGVAVSPSGDRLAWATGDGVRVYDPAADESRLVALDGASRVGTFSPDGSMLTVHADGLAVLEVASGEVVAEAAGSDPDVVRRSAWRADGSAVEYADGGDLVTVPADGSAPTTQPSPFDEAATLAWAPSGEQLVALEPGAEGVPRLQAAPLRAGGELGPARTVDTSGIALNRLLGFSGDDTVAVSAYLLESGSVERILDIPLDGGSVVDVTTLPPEDAGNWRDSATLAVSGQALRAGSTDFGNHVWPWSHRARLLACVLVGVFGLGLWLTRRRRMRRLRRR
jgi:hypothetical protein